MNTTKAERWIATFEYFLALVLGVLIGAIGTALHRQWLPWILILSIVAVLSAAIMVRAWIGLSGVAAFGAGVLVVIMVLSLSGPGGDVLLPAGDTAYLSYVWMAGSLLAVGAACFTPRRWFI